MLNESSLATPGLVFESNRAADGSLDWTPELGVSAFSVDSTLWAQVSSGDWAVSALGGPAVTIVGGSIFTNLVQAVSLPIAAPKLKVISFQFPQPGGWRAKLPVNAGSLSATRNMASARPAQAAA